MGAGSVGVPGMPGVTFFGSVGREIMSGILFNVRATKRRYSKSDLRRMPGEKRFWALCGKRAGCWEWQGYKNADGYGRIYVNGKNLSAHRLSYELNIGPIPDGMCVLHSCDNPACTNWSHLFIGTPAVNAADRDSKGRGADRSGAKNGRAKLTPDQVREIRRIWMRGGRTKVSIAKQFGVTDVAIFKAITGENWRHV
jgi:hypothetical protein